jgi:DNA gyrase subunit A
VPPPAEGAGEPEPPYAVAVSRGGMSLRFSLRAHAEPSTRAGRRFMRPESGDEVMFVSVATGEEKIACASVGGHALVCDVQEVSLLAGPGKGVTLMKLKGEDRLAGVSLLTRENPYMILEHESGRSFDIGVRGSHVGSRGGKGAILFKRGNAVRIEKPALVVPNLSGGANNENGA